MPEAGSIFATYTGRENRVTGTLVAVLQRLGVDLTDRILSGAAGEGSFELVSYLNQPSGKGEGVPDAEIRSSFRYLFETKVERGVIRGKPAVTQIQRHLARLRGDAVDERLFLLTPDPPNRSVTAQLENRPVTWITFLDLARAISDLIRDESEVASEQQRFLLRELIRFFEDEGLLDLDDVVIVPARWAYPAYLKTAAYICQADRTIREVTHIGFYTKREIKPEIARIRATHKHVVFSKAEAKRLMKSSRTGSKTLGGLMTWHLQNTDEPEGEAHDVYVLSPAKHSDTVRLSSPISHESGTAWVMKQRYTSLDRLRAARTTEDL